jgi:antitoxin (DNA-binding transcriptional repressor) of toxin-antitoxin stability system
MKVSVVDLRRKMPEVLRALEHQETVTILYRGKKKGLLYPVGRAPGKVLPMTEHPAFGMWKDRKDLSNVKQYVRKLRKGRSHDL